MPAMNPREGSSGVEGIEQLKFAGCQVYEDNVREGSPHVDRQDVFVHILSAGSMVHRY